MNARLKFIIPLAIFLGLAVAFGIGLTMNPKDIPSVLINKKIPPFDLPPIKGRKRGLKSADLIGQILLVNVFGSWCIACKIEHPFLMRIKSEGKVPLYGIDWLEKNRDDGPKWLKEKGDPYVLVGDDPNSKAAIAFGVTGAPETLVIDHKGVIRYKQIGPMNEEIWDKTIWPIIKELRKRQKESGGK
jgi:cytochrome c biogenesis protein CcmG/thiol:disulfide interchange protein DsbE